MQLDTFYALRNLNPTSSKQTFVQRKRAPLSRSEALIRFPIGTRMIRPYMVNNKTTNHVRQVYEVCSLFCRVRFGENDWEGLTISEVKRGTTEE